AVIPETHGPGGTGADGPDPAVIDEVHTALRELLGPDADIALWTEGELGIVSGQASEELIRLVDRARMRVRTLRHPRTEGAVVSFSAGIVCDDGRGLTETYHRACRFALDANQAGGDRVTTGQVARRTGRVLL